MSLGAKKALAAYGKQNLQSQVESASPGRLIVMLYEGAIKSIQLGRMHMQNGEIAEKGQAISKAISIIDEGLRLALDHEQGGELAANLDALYFYMMQQLLEANLRNTTEPLDQVLVLLNDLKEAWESISQPAAAQPPLLSEPAAEANQDRGTLSYGKA
ncbi:flagellar export chaperone FliS [Chitinilyticum litopenaei]|uniref:flagellar export chaperone FliS n=1 Tax=Chitinilyticum litopenaei TaxID=1121276 RepID=UPI00040E5929|nr:flagellar export chaperone FliS [Chitinilyticum litopenaei]